ncbi:MAG: polymer-forming cytoskeletal protein [Thiomicrospira sp.]|uniref:bactofilin family protein n=1 Tax=Thiomicrospira sp. TaxID=935 RepID=UPI001A07ECE9|nr:polymer-forming cytoskeletal protein [Thiomicrospira sp.]MBE0493417.1 polymer-forming cytoskeletal protein [Thiomicrospira sp.]
MGIFKSGDQKPSREGGKTIIAEGCSVNGEIVDLQGALHIDGHIDGIVETSYDISIGQNGSLNGLIKARSIFLSGKLEGKVACERIEILETGKLVGELISGELTIETGGKFIGQSRELSESGIIVGVEDEKPAQIERPKFGQESDSNKDEESDLDEKKA